MSGTELVTRREYQGLTMAVSPAESLQRIKELQAFVQQAMVKDVDYGTIPGTEKNTLLQPGAQKLAEIYGFSVTFEDVETVQDWTGDFFLFRKRAVLRSRRDDSFVGDGIGSCNSKESRYAYRWIFDNEVSNDVDKSTLRRRTFYSKKKQREYVQYRQPNEDICSLANTIEKMACKRALVHAVIGATRSSGLFMQDVEDLPAEVFGSVGASRSWEDDEDSKAPEVPPALRNQPPPAAAPVTPEPAVTKPAPKTEKPAEKPQPAPVTPSAARESEAAATLPVGPPKVAAAPTPPPSPPSQATLPVGPPKVAAAPTPPPSPPSQAALTIANVMAAIAASRDKAALIASRKLLDRLATEKIGTLQERNQASAAWISRKGDVAEGRA
jgi:hypothetical protein